MLPPVILLDLDDTILDDTGGASAAWEQACIESGAPDGLYDAIRSAGAWFWSDADRHREGRADLGRARATIVATALETLGLPDDGLSERISTRLNVLRDEAIAPLPGAIDALDELRGRGVRLGLLDQRQRPAPALEDRAVRAQTHFDYVGIEGEVGFGKPEAEAFLRALRALEPAPADAWMVGDNLVFDVGGAQAVGMHGVWVDIRGRGLPRVARGGARPHRHVDRRARGLSDTRPRGTSTRSTVTSMRSPSRNRAALAAVQRRAELGHLELLAARAAGSAPCRRRRRRSARTARRRSAP